MSIFKNQSFSILSFIEISAAVESVIDRDTFEFVILVRIILIINDFVQVIKLKSVWHANNVTVFCKAKESRSYNTNFCQHSSRIRYPCATVRVCAPRLCSHHWFLSTPLALVSFCFFNYIDQTHQAYRLEGQSFMYELLKRWDIFWSKYLTVSYARHQIPSLFFVYLIL